MNCNGNLSYYNNNNYQISLKARELFQQNNNKYHQRTLVKDTHYIS